MIYQSQKQYEIPQLDLLSFLFDYPGTLAEESTIVHADAAHPSRGISKSVARSLTKCIAHTLRVQFGIGENEPGRDVVVIMSTGQSMLPILFYGILAAGGVVSSAPFSLPPELLASQIKHLDAKLCIISPDLKEVLEKAATLARLPLEKALVLESTLTGRLYQLVDEEKHNLFGQQELNWERIVNKNKLEDSLVCILYSAGTTGTPKGIRVSHSNLVAQTYLGGQALREYWKDHEHWQVRALAHLPTAHVSGVMGYFIYSFYHGGTTFWMPRFELSAFIGYNRSLQITNTFTLPPVLSLVVSSPLVTDHFDGSKVITVGGTSFNKELHAHVKAKFGKGVASVSQTWGMSETTGSVTGFRLGEADVTGSVGRVFPNVQVRIIGMDGHDVPADGQTRGEVLVKGPILTNGYYNDILTTAGSIRDGWFHTGDMGFFQADLLYITDRKQDLINYKGHYVSPTELETVLLSHSAIRDAAVIGVYNLEEDCEVPRAYVVLHSTTRTPFLPEDIVDFMAGNVEDFKKLRGGVKVIDTVPRSPVGKILRRELRLSEL